MQKETRGRKKLPENEKKKPLTLFLTQTQIEILGGETETKKLLQNYSLTKIKQNAKKII